MPRCAAGAPSNAAVAGTGMEPIHWAATRGHTEVVRRLLKAEFELLTRPPAFLTPGFDGPDVDASHMLLLLNHAGMHTCACATVRGITHGPGQ